MGKAVWGAAIALALAAPAIAAPHPDASGRGQSKFDGAVRLASTAPAQRVIVTVRPGTQADVRKRLLGQGATVVKEHGIVHAFTVSVDARGLAALGNDPDVEHISADAEVGANDAKSGSGDAGVVSNLKKMLALGNWFTGSSLTVAVIDSGMADTSDFSGRILATYDFTSGSTWPRMAIDEYGHGTHVAGLIGASGTVSSGYYAGVAPGIKFLSLRVLDKKGSGKTSAVIDALQFAVANRARFNIRIINLSLGHPIYESATTDPLVQAVEAAARAGIVVVTAAGNYGTNPVTGKVGYAGLTSPGNAPSAITVGAAVTGTTVERTDDRVATYSSRGPTWFDGYGKPDVLAPGSGLISDMVDGSTLALAYPSLVYSGSSGKLMRLSGSSMATGVVSGLVAVMIEAHDYAAQQRYDAMTTKYKRQNAYVAPPALTPNAIKAMLQYAATPLRDEHGVKYDALTQGAGEVDGLAAVTLAYYADTAQAVGSAWIGAFTPTTQFGTDLETWSQQIVWGTRAVSGSGLMQVNQAAWSQAMTWGSGELDNIVWGTFSAEADNIVWGTALTMADVVWAGSVMEQDNIVWGTSLAAWGPNIVWGTAIGVMEGDNIVWGTAADGEGDNIVWGTMTDGEGDNIVWGTVELDNIVWGTSNKVLGLVLGGVL